MPEAAGDPARPQQYMSPRGFPHIESRQTRLDEIFRVRNHVHDAQRKAEMMLSARPASEASFSVLACKYIATSSPRRQFRCTTLLDTYLTARRCLCLRNRRLRSSESAAAAEVEKRASKLYFLCLYPSFVKLGPKGQWQSDGGGSPATDH